MTINEDEKIKNSFKRVKEEIDNIKSEINELTGKIGAFLPNLKEKDHQPKEPFFEISSGNKGVINHHQPSSTIINHDLKNLKNIKNELNELFKDLSDREFSIFLAIYTLEEELGRTVSLQDLANKLKISEITVRGYINTLISKNIPIIKERPFNKKIILSINKDFRDLALISRILSIRNQKNSQKTLFDT